MHKSKTLGIVLVALLLASMDTVVAAFPWGGVSYDPPLAQAIWVDPKITPCLSMGETFVVDVLIKITDPPDAATGLYGFQYTLKWNSIMLEAESIRYHSPWPMPPAFLVINETGSGSPRAPEGFDYHWLAISAMPPNAAFAGASSLCTYTFRVVGDGGSILDIYDEELVDDTATELDHTTVDGIYCPAGLRYYQLTVSVAGSGTTDPAPGSYMYDEGSVVSVDAIPDFGWMLDHWLLDTVDVGATDPYTVTMDANHTLTAVFVEKPQYELTIEVAGSGTTDPAPGSYMHVEGSLVPVDAVPDVGWMLNHWLLDTVDVGATDPYTVTMDANHTLTAVFVEKLQYELTIEVAGSGTTDPAPGSHMYDDGYVVSVDAIPDAGWMLDHWLLDTVDVGATDPYTVTMDANHTLTAVFVETGIPYVYVDPTVSVANPSEYFNISIKVEKAPKLFAWTFKLRWNKKVLGFPPGPPYPGDNTLCNVTEGTFLSSAGPTTFMVVPNFLESKVLVGCSLANPVATPPSRNGTLATFRFLVVDSGVSNLTLFGVELYDYATGGVVPGVTIQDGYFYTQKPFVDFTWTPVSPEVNEVATFNASACWDPDGGNITQFSWDFGDGNVTVIGDDEPVTPIITHKYSSYNQSGWQVTLTATDDENETWSTTHTVGMWHDIAVWDIWPTIYRDYDWWFMDTVDRKVIRGEWLWILGTMLNLGTYEEVTNVTMTARHVATDTTIALPWFWYVNETATPWSETNAKVTIGPYAGSGWDLMFHWNTDDALPGVWELTLAATPVLGESNIANNNMSRFIEILLYGELSLWWGEFSSGVFFSRTASLTGKITITDVVIGAKALGSQREDNPVTPWDETKNWNKYVDFNNDGIIDIRDLVRIGVNFGKTW